MGFKQINSQDIQKRTSPGIYARGELYFHAGLVQGLRAFAAEDKILAEVLGNFGIYEVSLNLSGRHLDGECNCPYDKSPCKHMVAVALEFIHHRAHYLQEARRWQQTRQSLRSRLGSERPQVLVELILHAARQSPLFEQEVHLRYAESDPQTHVLMREHIRKVLEDSEMDYVAFRQAEKSYRQDLQRVKTLSAQLKLGVGIAILETVVRIFNAYGLEDQGLENLCLELWEQIQPELQQPHFQAEYQQLRLFLKRELRRENCLLIQLLAEELNALEVSSDFQLLHA